MRLEEKSYILFGLCLLLHLCLFGYHIVFRLRMKIITKKLWRSYYQSFPLFFLVFAYQAQASEEEWKIEKKEALWCGFSPYGLSLEFLQNEVSYKKLSISERVIKNVRKKSRHP